MVMYIKIKIQYVLLSNRIIEEVKYKEQNISFILFNERKYINYLCAEKKN